MSIVRQSTSARGASTVARLVFAALLAAGSVAVPGFAEAAKKEAQPPAPAGPKFSKPVQKLLKASQDAFEKQDFPTSLTAAREALAAATTDDDKRFAMRFVYRCVVSLKDWPAAIASLKEYLASGLAEGDETVRYTRVLTQLHLQIKDYPGAIEWYQKYLPLAGSAATVEDYDTATSVALNQKQPLLAAEILQSFRAQRGDAALTERLLLLMNTAYYRAEKPADRRWVMVQLLSRFAKPDYMHDYLALLMDGSTDERTLTNVFRLAYARNLMKKGSQYTEFAEKLLNQGSPGEAVEVLEAGISSGAIKQPNDTAKSLLDQARPLAADDRKGTPAYDKEARAKQNGELDVKLGLGYVGQKQFEKAVEAVARGLQPERIAKVKRVDESRLLLGYAYYRLGRMDEAKAAFAAAGEDARAAELSRLWIALLDADAAAKAAAAAAEVAASAPPAPAPAVTPAPAPPK